jgi:hypothetical protein
MRAYDFILFLAFLGAVNSTLDYMYQSEFSDNWFDSHTDSWDMEMIVINDDTVNDFDEGDTVSQDEQDSYSTNIWALGSILVNAFYMLFDLDDAILDTLLYVPDPDNPSVNLMEPVNDVIMTGIYVIVIFGIYQVKAKTSTKHYE